MQRGQSGWAEGEDWAALGEERSIRLFHWSGYPQGEMVIIGRLVTLAADGAGLLVKWGRRCNFDVFDVVGRRRVIEGVVPACLRVCV